MLEADGGTRCASITGGYVALALACRRLIEEGKLKRSPLTGSVAAVSCGVVDGVPLLDLDYPEDSSAEVDANVVMTGDGGLVEVQATAERTPLSRAHLDELLRSRRAGSRRCARRRTRRSPLSAACELLLATRNAHKLREFDRLLPGRHARCRCPTARRAPEETGDTYAENALIKARAAARATGRAAIADDSGIEAEALDWRPGVRTARFAGEHATDAENLQKLHREAPGRARGLRYVCVVAHVTPDGDEHLFEGRCTGTLAPEPRGEGGFGYDPLFIADEAPGRTMAELTDEEKDAISHRGHAARALLAWLLRTG